MEIIPKRNMKQELHPRKKLSMHPLRRHLFFVMGFVALIWAISLADLWFLDVRTKFSLVPRTIRGSVGILTMHFFHGDLLHLWSNTVPLVVLMSLLAGTRAKTWEIIVLICLIGGTFLWIFGDPIQIIRFLIWSERKHGAHIGASLLVFGLITFLVSSGVFEKRPLSIVISILVAVMYGFTFLLGVIPGLRANVSWEGHLSGGVAGVLVAYWLTSSGGLSQPSETSSTPSQPPPSKNR